MTEMTRVIAATDFSAAAERAMLRAASLASTSSGELHLVHVLPPSELLQDVFVEDVENEVERLRARAMHALEQRAAPLAARFDVKPTCTVVQGRAHEAIMQVAQSLDATLIVAGAQGEQAREASPESIGGTAFKLIARSTIPTLLVRRHLYRSYGDVVACAKGVLSDRSVIEWANRMSPKSLLHILSAHTVPHERRLVEWGASQKTLDAYVARERDDRTRQLSALLEAFGLMAARARLHVTRGDPVDTILRHAAEWNSDLIVVGQRSRAPEGFAGSIARQIASRAAADVLVVSTKATSRTEDLMNSQFG